MDSVLSQLGVTSFSLEEHQALALDREGYLVIPDLIDRAWLDELRNGFEAMAKQRPALGPRQTGTRHLEGLVSAGPAFERICANAKVLAAVYRILGRPFRLGQLHGRDPLPGYGQQGLHTDWRPRTTGEQFHAVTAIWLLDDFTKDNGATRLVPGTHLLTGMVPKRMADPASHHPDERLVIASAGSLLVFNGHIWHSGTRNESVSSRRALQCSFAATDGLLPATSSLGPLDTLSETTSAL